MSSFRASTFQSFGQYFCMLALVLSFGFAEKAHAACDDRDDQKEYKEKCSTSSDRKKNNSDCTRMMLQGCDKVDSATKSSSTDRCGKAIDNATKAYSNFIDDCKDAGLGKSCLDTLKTCDSIAGDSDSGTDDFFDKIVQSFPGTNKQQATSKCSKYSGKDYFQRNKEYQKDLKDNNKDLADIKKETAELNDQFNKDIQDIQKEIQEAQDDLKKKQLDIKKAQRERAADMAKTSAQVAAEIRKKQSEVLQLRTQIAETYRSKNSTMIAMSDAAAKRACMKKVNDLRKEYTAIQGGSLRSGFTAASTKKKELNDTYTECMSQFDVQRNALVSQTEEKVQAIQNQIDNNQSDIDNANQQLASMKSQEQQEQADEATQISNETQTITTKIQRAQERLTSLQQTTQAKAKALEEKQKTITEDSNRINTAISKMGAVPESETTKSSVRDAETSYDALKTAERAVQSAKDENGDPCQYKYITMDESSSKTKASSSSSNKKMKGQGAP